MILFDCSREQAKSLTQQLVNHISQHPFFWEGKIYHVGASAGITCIDAASGKSGELLAQADIACYTAKHRGRGQVYLYEARQKMMLEHQHQLLTRQEVADIIADGQLMLSARAVAPPKTPQAVCFYQLTLQVMAIDGRSLTRDELITAAQLYGLQQELDRWVIGEILTQCAADISYKGLSVALPLATDSLLDTAFRSELLTALNASPLQPGALLLMVEDAALLEHAAICKPFVHQLQQRGCKLIVNGFGHNLNAFDELHGQKIDYIRIDERFITNVHCNQMDELMVSMLNSAAHRVHAQTLAGPAHQQITLNTLQAIGVDLADGDTVALELPLSELLGSGYFGIR